MNSIIKGYHVTCMDNFFCSEAIVNISKVEQLHACGTVWKNHLTVKNLLNESRKHLWRDENLLHQAPNITIMSGVDHSSAFWNVFFGEKDNEID